MRSAVIINFSPDYSDQKLFWSLNKMVIRSMVNAGFHREGHLFTTDSSVTEARLLACSVIDSIDKNQNIANRRIVNNIREFYCFEMRNVSNLLVPGEGRTDLQNELVDIKTLLSREEMDALLKEFYDDSDCTNKDEFSPGNAAGITPDISNPRTV